ncbi:MAG: hypothetical protein IJ058_06195 [Lachnospiraceae bacterium]|nr:hypothetical protein [Lachnospiraceae bacterium]
MLDPERIALMARLASFEKNEEKHNASIWQYFRGDYIGWQVLKSIVAGTVIFGIILGGYVIYNFENFMIEIYKMDLLEYAKDILTKYVVFIGVYSVITYIVFTWRYAVARKNLRMYVHNLNKLSKNYDED